MTEQDAERLLEAERFAAWLTRIWAPPSLCPQQESPPKWFIESVHFRFEIFVAENVRFEINLFPGCSRVSLNREIIHLDEARPWYEDPLITVTGSLLADETGEIRGGYMSETGDRELYEQFATDWMPYFRRNCWLSGYPIECSNHEKVEWMRGFNREEIEQWKAQPAVSMESHTEQYDRLVSRMDGVLKKLGISRVEHLVLIELSNGACLVPEELIGQMVQSLEDQKLGFSHSDYVQALNGCIEKGLVQMLTPESYEVETNRRQSSLLPELCKAQAQVGEVGLTLLGRSIYYQIDFQRIGHNAYNSGFNLIKGKREFEILALNTEFLKQKVQEILLNASNFVGEKVEVISVGDPEPIGPWKPNPFVTLPQGFRCLVVYKPA